MPPTTEQTQLFATAPVPPPAPAVKPTIRTATPPPASPPETLTTEELIERIFLDMCRSHRWERELLLGASDQELGKSFGRSWCSGPNHALELHFYNEGEPALRIVDGTFKIEIATLSTSEVASYVRRIVQIPEEKTVEERAAILAQRFNQIGIEERQNMLSYIRSLLCEKRVRKPRKGEPQTPPPLSNQVAELLFTQNHLDERSERRLLIRIVRLLTRNGSFKTLAATKHAVAIMDMAQMHWQSATGYWLDTFEPTDYQPGAAISP